MAILAKMAYLAKMAEMALNRQNRKFLNKNSNEKAKGPFGEWRFRRKLRIWRKWRKWRLIAEITKLLTKMQIRWQRGLLESGNFGENGRNGA